MTSDSTPIPFDSTGLRGWRTPDISVLEETDLQPPNLPLEVFGKDWAEWIQNTAKCASAPPDYVAIALITASAGLIGNARRCSPWEGWSEATAFWSCLVGQPSYNKSPALDSIRKIIRRLEADMAPAYEEALAEHKTAVEAARAQAELWQQKVKQAVKNDEDTPLMPTCAIEPDHPPRPRIAIMNTTVEEVINIIVGQPKGLIQIRDELASFLGDMSRYNSGSGDRGFYLEAFSGRSYICDRVKFEGTPKIIPHLTLSVLGTSQPDKVNSTILRGDDDGLASRFLYVWPRRAPLIRPRTFADDDWAYSALAQLHRLKMAPGDGHGLTPIVRRLSSDAADEFDAWRQDHGLATDRESGLLQGHMGKLPGLALRFALVLELLWWCASSEAPEPSEVSRKAMLAAIALATDYFTPMARRVFGNACLPRERRLATALARYLVSNQLRRINKRETYRSGHVLGIRTAADFDMAAKYLQDCDFMVPAPSRVGSSPGVQRSDYVINPLVYEIAE